MTLRIDSAGRIVLPKTLRQRLGLEAGAELELTEAVGGVLLRLAERRPSLVREGRFLVHAGAIPAQFDAVRAIEDDRVARSYELLGSR